MPDTVTLKSRETVYKDPYLTVEDRIYDHKGRDYRYLVKDEPDFAVVGAVTEEGDILMVRQFRPGPGKYLYDVPGGVIDPGQTPEDAARAELREETGYIGDIQAVATAYVTAYSSARKHIFLAFNCRRVGPHEEEDTIIGHPVLVKREDFAALIRGGDVLDLDCMLLLAKALEIEV